MEETKETSRLLRDSDASGVSNVSLAGVPVPGSGNSNIIQNGSTLIHNPYVQQSLHTSPSNVSLAGSIIDEADLEHRPETLYGNAKNTQPDIVVPSLHGRVKLSLSNISLAGSIIDRSTRGVNDGTEYLTPYEGFGPYVQQDLRTSPSNVSLAGSIDLNVSSCFVGGSDDENCPTPVGANYNDRNESTVSEQCVSSVTDDRSVYFN